MTAIEPRTREIVPENEEAARTWSAGGEAYDRISRQIADAIRQADEKRAGPALATLARLARR